MRTTSRLARNMVKQSSPASAWAETSEVALEPVRSRRGEYCFVAPSRLRRPASGERCRRAPRDAAPPPRSSFADRAPRSPSSPPPGVIVAGRYRIEDAIREGGMGAVFRARDLRLDIPVAVKFVRGDRACSEATERLVREARAAAQVSHPSTVRVIDVDVAEWGDTFFVMELLEGGSLAEALDRDGPFTPEDAVQIVLPLVDAVAAAHAEGIVHRDIKPQNIILCSADGATLVPKLVDFGIAKLLRGSAEGRITGAGTLLGSVEYMAPEQAQGRTDVDAQADVWALCVVLFETITGITPFRGSSPLATLAAIHVEPPRDDARLRSEPELSLLLRRGLTKDRTQRWSSARELGRALARWALDRGIEADAAGTSLAVRWGFASRPPVSLRASAAVAR